MSEESGAEKSEDPTARRLSKAREDGQVARSIEAPAAAVTVGAVLLMMVMGSWLVTRIGQLFTQGFVFDRKTLDTPQLLPSTFFHQVAEGYLLITPIFLVTAVAAILASGLTGGYLFSWGSLSPKFSKIDPFSGLQRVFGTKALVELLKSVAKFSLVAWVLWLLINRHMNELMLMGHMALEPAMGLAGQLITESVLWLSLCLAFIALIDAPYQRYAFFKRMKMTKQEIKDEMKDSEGQPEVKAQIRRRQREMANSRMMQKVKDADVIITNPEHFAVALSYDPTADGAPILLAKGTDIMATRIREEAKAHGVEIFQAAPLARALYFTTKLDQPVPETLYFAVAQVIAYVFSLAQIRPGVEPMARPYPKVPSSMLFNADGQLQTGP
jgi:flagellar biosynthetic protein FlhB